MRLFLLLATLLLSQIIFAEETITVRMNNNSQFDFNFAVEFPTQLIPHLQKLKMHEGYIYTYNLEDSGLDLKRPFDIKIKLQVWEERRHQFCTLPKTINAVGILNPIIEINVKNFDIPSQTSGGCNLDVTVREDYR